MLESDTTKCCEDRNAAHWSREQANDGTCIIHIAGRNGAFRYVPVH